MVMAKTLSERLVSAASHGDAVEVKQVLMENVVFPEYGCLSALWYAAHNGHDDIVKMLLTDGRANPLDDDSSALRWAAFNSHVRVVKALLKDGRVDPTTPENEAMWVFIKNRHAEVDELLERAISGYKRWNSRCGTAHTIVQLSLYYDARRL